MATTPIYGFTLPVVAGDSGIWGGENNADITQYDQEFARLRVPFLTPAYNVGGTTTLDCSQTTGARVFLLTVSGASTLAFSGVPSSSFDCKISLFITNGSAFALTFPASVTWLAGAPFTLRSAGQDIVDLETKDGGTTWFATLRRPTSGVLHTAVGLSTASTTEVSLDAYTVPAGTLSLTGQALRLSLAGLSGTQNGHVRVKFGSTYWLNTGDVANASAGIDFTANGILMRSAAATAKVSFVFHGNVSGFPQFDRPGMGETLANALVVDVRGYVVAGGTLNVDYVLLELLGP